MSTQVGGLVAVALLVAGCGADPAAPPPAARYRLTLEASGTELRGALLSIGGASGEVTVLAGGDVLAEVTPGASPFVLLIGPLEGNAVLEVDAATPGTAPSVAIMDASAGAAEGYRRVAAATVTASWEGVR
jgi:hypothetical protein